MLKITQRRDDHIKTNAKHSCCPCTCESRLAIVVGSEVAAGQLIHTRVLDHTDEKVMQRTKKGREVVEKRL